MSRIFLFCLTLMLICGLNVGNADVVKGRVSLSG